VAGRAGAAAPFCPRDGEGARVLPGRRRRARPRPRAAVAAALPLWPFPLADARSSANSALACTRSAHLSDVNGRATSTSPSTPLVGRHHHHRAGPLAFTSPPQAHRLATWCAPTVLSRWPSARCSATRPLPLAMELGTILNARLTAHAGTGSPFGMQHAMQHQPQHFAAQPAYMNGHIKSENGSERGVSPHPSDSSRYSSQQPQQPLPSYPPIPAQHMNGMRYPSPTPMQQAPMQMLNNNSYIPNPQENPYAQQQVPDQQVQHAGGRPANENGPPKAFACSTCGKGFARRSDLARHGKLGAWTSAPKPFQH
jgi:hypothetical protein